MDAGRRVRGYRGMRPWPLGFSIGIVLIVALSLGGLLAGCSKKGSGTRAAQVYLSPEWNELGIESVAFLGVGSSTGDETDRAEAERIVEDELGGRQARFIVISGRVAESRAETAKDKYVRVIQVWRDDRKVDQFLAKDLCAAMGVDGLIFGDLNDWTEHRIDRTQEGTSWSRVSLGLYIYSAKNGLLVWGADRASRKDSMVYRPGVGEESEVSARRAEVSVDTPEPPLIEELARELIQELFDMFPPRE